MKIGCRIYVESEAVEVKNGAATVLTDHSAIDNRVTVEMLDGKLWDLKPEEIYHRPTCPIKHGD